MEHPTAANRQYGLDWLRIGAFGLLILYHSGMFFVPWSWHVKTAVPVEWLVWPMKMVNPWRLLLLFLISGVVSRIMLGRLGSAAFARSRSLRLLIPLLAGIFIFVVPQPWYELRDRGAYQHGLLHFWLHDYFEFGTSLGTPVPTYNHLWFVAYLWVYSMILALATLAAPRLGRLLQAGFDRLASGPGLFVLPVLWFWLARAILFPIFGETHALIDDPYAHVVYAFSFFFGVGLAGAPRAWEMIVGWWKLALLGAGIGYALTVFVDVSGATGGAVGVARAFARATLAWGAILGLLGFARTHLNHDHKVRRYLTEAVFPFYIVHQTAIIAIGFTAKQVGIGTGMEALLVILGTVAICFLAYEISRRVPALRPIMGLKLRAA